MAANTCYERIIVRSNPFTHTNFDEIVYLLQGGGALGAFQVGVYQALEEGGFVPDWIVGISIGAINAAIIAGNQPEKCTAKLYQFWDIITHKAEPQLGFVNAQNQDLIQAYNVYSAWGTLNFGQSGFFTAKGFSPWLMQNSSPDKISFYDTNALRKTLLEVVDFAYLNAKHVRLSLGAVNVQDGRLKFFDNTKEEITVEHIMASCALPPGFPAIKIDDAYYWDGGLYSNTPLICVINDRPHKNRLCFLVDLFDSTGMMPRNLDEVLERAKDITYAGQVDLMLDYYQLHLGNTHNVHISKIVYKANRHDLHSKDYEFSNFSARRRFVDGYMYTKTLLADPNWWKEREESIGIITR